MVESIIERKERPRIRPEESKYIIIPQKDANYNEHAKVSHRGDSIHTLESRYDSVKEYDKLFANYSLTGTLRFEELPLSTIENLKYTMNCLDDYNKIHRDKNILKNIMKKTKEWYNDKIDDDKIFIKHNGMLHEIYDMDDGLPKYSIIKPNHNTNGPMILYQVKREKQRMYVGRKVTSDGLFLIIRVKFYTDNMKAQPRETYIGYYSKIEGINYLALPGTITRFNKYTSKIVKKLLGTGGTDYNKNDGKVTCIGILKHFRLNTDLYVTHDGKVADQTRIQPQVGIITYIMGINYTNIDIQSRQFAIAKFKSCLLYTSDAADED